MGVAKLDKKPDGDPGIFSPSWVGYTPKDGSPEYFRTMHPFAFWSIKSESSVMRDWRPVFLDQNDKELMTLWHDFASMEQFPNPLPRYMEHRRIDGGLGRGYDPTYVKAGDWLIFDSAKWFSVPNEQIERFKKGEWDAVHAR